MPYCWRQIQVVRSIDADVLDRRTMLCCEPLRAFTHPIAQRRGKLGAIKNPDALRVQKARHALCVTHSRQRARDHDPVVARQHPRPDGPRSVRQAVPSVTPSQSVSRAPEINLFGSGSSGLGFVISFKVPLVFRAAPSTNSSSAGTVAGRATLFRGRRRYP